MKTIFQYLAVITCGVFLTTAIPAQSQENALSNNELIRNLSVRGAIERAKYADALQLAFRNFSTVASEQNATVLKQLVAMERMGAASLLSQEIPRSQAYYETVLRQARRSDDRFVRGYLGVSLHNLGIIYSMQGRNEEAVLLFRDALEFAQTVVEDTHVNVNITMNNLAIALARSGNAAQAIEILEELARENEQSGVIADTAYLPITLRNLGFARVVAQDFSEVGAVFARYLSVASDTSRAELAYGPSTTAFIIGDDAGIGPPVDCSNYNGGVGPYNPDPETGGEDAQCGPFGTRPTYGMWGDWGNGAGDSGNPCPACPPCPICGDSGGGNGEEPEPPEECADLDCIIDEVTWQCDVCLMDSDAGVSDCLAKYMPKVAPNNPPSNPITPLPFVHSSTSTAPLWAPKPTHNGALQRCFQDVLDKLVACENKINISGMGCGDLSIFD